MFKEPSVHDLFLFAPWSWGKRHTFILLSASLKTCNVLETFLTHRVELLKLQTDWSPRQLLHLLQLGRSLPELVWQTQRSLMVWRNCWNISEIKKKHMLRVDVDDVICESPSGCWSFVFYQQWLSVSNSFLCVWPCGVQSWPPIIFLCLYLFPVMYR